MNKIFRRIRDSQSIKKWHREFKRVHPEMYNYEGDPQKLRLILGPGRSGTSWLARTLEHTETPIRYVHEVLPHLHPKYLASKRFDKTAIECHELLNDVHPLVRIYKITTYPDIKHSLFISDYFEKKIGRNDSNFEFVLHKEVHALLATEGLINNLKCPIVLITRNPIYVVDSLLTYKDVSVPLWRNESKYITNSIFLGRFFLDNKDKIIKNITKYPDDGVNRTNVIIAKTLTIAVINRMLQRLAEKYNNVKHIYYEDLIQDPIKLFAETAEFLNLDFKEQAKAYLKKTLKAKDEEFDHTSIYRDTRRQLNRPFKGIYEDEVEIVNAVLKECDLI